MSEPDLQQTDGRDPSRERGGNCFSWLMTAIGVVVGLMVVAIMGLILFPPFSRSGSRERGREKACYANMRVIMSAIEQYAMDNLKNAPVLPDDLAPVAMLKREQYLKTEPQCPADPGTARYRAVPERAPIQSGGLADDVPVSADRGSIWEGCVVICPVHGTVE